MRRALAVALIAVTAISTPAVAQSGGTVSFTGFLQNVFFTNTGTSTLTQLQYSLGPAANGVATWDSNGGSSLGGAVASDFLSNPNYFQTATWSGLNVLPAGTLFLGRLDIDLITTLSPLSVDEQTVTGGLQGASIRATFSNGNVMSASLQNGNWQNTQNLTLGPVVPQTAVPEPSTVTLLAAGVAGLALVARRRKTRIGAA